MTDAGPSGINPYTELRLATEQLRSRVPPRAVTVQNDVLQRALRTSRRSIPLRVQPPYDFVVVSHQVLIAELRRQIDALSPTGAVGRIYLRIDPDRTLRAVTVELFVQYGAVIVELADRVRAVAAQVLGQTLGAAAASVDVVLTDVHVSDVTADSPHLVDPSDGAV